MNKRFDDKMGSKFLESLRGFQHSAEDMDAVVFGEAVDMIEKLLKGLGSAHVALLNRHHANTAEGRAIMDEAAADVAQVLAYVRAVEAQI